MRPPIFPFSALVGLDPLKTALRLAAVDMRLSVLVRGDKGTGKSTAARALGPLLAEGAPFVNLPIGATEDRLLGGLDIERAVRGEPALKPGLLAEADGGVLYIDEVNLLPEHLADALLDAVASGLHVVEHEGYSAVQAAHFVLIGSMNPEEGTLRPQLLDRFALVVEASAPADPAERREAVERRLRFDRDPEAFVIEWESKQEALALTLQRARGRLSEVACSAEILDGISRTVCERGVRSLRADLAIVRASRALAALDGSSEVLPDHVEAVLPLALGHRAPSRERAPEPPRGMAPPPPPSEDRAGASGGEAAHERIFAPREVTAPRIAVRETAPASGTGPRTGPASGPAVRSRLTCAPQELDVRGTVVHSLGRNATTQFGPEDLHEKVRVPRAGTRFLLVVDSSGSHAVEQRMRSVKGALNGLLEASVRREDEVALIVVRGAAAAVALEPTRSLEESRRALEYLPTGGRTPLAHGLELAARFVIPSTVLVLITDGRANVPSRSDDPWLDALAAASEITCPALVVDSETSLRATGRARELARAMRATHVELDGLDANRLSHLLGPILVEQRRES